MAYRKESEQAIVERREALLKLKIAQERASIEHGDAAPGTPIDIPHIAGETRIARLLRWEEALLLLKNTKQALIVP